MTFTIIIKIMIKIVILMFFKNILYEVLVFKGIIIFPIFLHLCQIKNKSKKDKKNLIKNEFIPRISFSKTLLNFKQIFRQIDRQKDRWMDRQLYRHRQINRQMEKQMDRQIDRWLYRQIHRQIDGYIDGQIDRGIDIQIIDTQIDRQIDE